MELDIIDYGMLNNDEDGFEDMLSTRVEARTVEQLEIDRIDLANRYKLITLEKLCLRDIINNMDSYIQTFEQRLKVADAHDFTGPFEGLPCKLLDIIYYEYEKHCKEEDIRFFSTTTGIFMTMHARNLTLTHLSSTDEKLLLIMKTKCQQNLQKLSLKHCKINEPVLHALLPELKNLIGLDLEGTQITDKTVEIITTHMKSLSELGLSSKGLTIKGINILCKRKIKQLNIIKLNGFMTNNDGINVLLKILQAYPDLHELGHKYLCDALVSWKKTHPNKVTKLNTLEIIIMEGFGIPRFDYYSILQCCPQLTNLTVKDFTKHDFNTEDAINYGRENCGKLFLKQIRPNNFASETVTKLHLFSVKIMDVTRILKDFPNVYDLTLTNCVLEYTRDTYDPSELFKKLKSFYFYQCFYKRSIEVIKDIFFSANLENVAIMECKYAHRFVLDRSRSMHFKSLKTDCMLTKWVEDIIIQNKNLESISIEPATAPCFLQMDEIDERLEYLLNPYFRDILKGEIRAAQLSDNINNEELRMFMQEYNSAVESTFVSPDLDLY